MILLDSNILIYAHAADSPFHVSARQLRDQAAQGALSACLSPQVLCEFFSVITDDRLVKPVLSPAQAKREISTYWNAGGFHRIVPKETTVSRLVSMLDRHPLKRRDIFDAFLVATMLDNDIRTIYTRNVKDFEVYPEIQVINPLGSPASSM